MVETGGTSLIDPATLSYYGNSQGGIMGGAVAAYYEQRSLLEAAAALAFLTGASAVAGLAWGCILMVRETQIAVHYLEEEARIRTHYKTPANPK